RQQRVSGPDGIGEVQRKSRDCVRVPYPLSLSFVVDGELYGFIGIRRNLVRLPDRTMCRTICDIRTREFERPPAVVSAGGVELRGMVRESEQVSLKKLIEAKARGVELCLRLFKPFLRDEHVGKTPPDLRIAARKRWQE